MRKLRILATLCAAMLLTGCAGETRKSSSESVSTSERTEEGSLSTEDDTGKAATEPAPDILLSSRVNKDKLLFKIQNVYSDGGYYEADICGEKLDENSGGKENTVIIDGELYGDFKIRLYKDGTPANTIAITIPDGDRFLIMESVKKELEYGCEVMSNKRLFGADEYPDIIQLDFYKANEVEVPQYARYFAVFDGKLAEVPVYENGVETSPYGTHPELKSAGLMTQHLTADDGMGGYTVLKFEYTFDVENKRLEKKQVQFYGWEE